MKVLIVNGPNLNMLGLREPDIYGSVSYDMLVEYLKEKFAKLTDTELEFYQSNVEGEIVTKLQRCFSDKDYAGLVINAGAYAHYSIAIRDALAMLTIPKVNVHISNTAARESFRNSDVISAVCDGTIAGLGLTGYELAIRFICKKCNI